MPSEALSLTYSELMYFAKGVMKRNEDEWSRARYLSFCVLTPHSKKIKKPTDLFKLPSEIVKDTMTPEERKRKAMDALKKVDPEKYKKING